METLRRLVINETLHKFYQRRGKSSATRAVTGRRDAEDCATSCRTIKLTENVSKLKCLIEFVASRNLRPAIDSSICLIAAGEAIIDMCQLVKITQRWRKFTEPEENEKVVGRNSPETYARLSKTMEKVEMWDSFEWQVQIKSHFHRISKRFE